MWAEGTLRCIGSQFRKKGSRAKALGSEVNFLFLKTKLALQSICCRNVQGQGEPVMQMMEVIVKGAEG